LLEGIVESNLFFAGLLGLAWSWLQ
jgi:hypothetical protein